MTVDQLRDLHLEKAHFYSEQAPGDAIAELGVFGTAPASPTFGGTRMSTNAPDHPAVTAHSRYFEPGSEALENMVDVVTGQYDDISRHRAAFPEIAGGLVAWALRMPVVPLRAVGRHYRGPGFRVLVNWCRLVDLGASETGNLVCEVLDEGERALLWFAHRVGALQHPHGHTEGVPGPEPEPQSPDVGGPRTGLRLAPMEVVVTDEARTYAGGAAVSSTSGPVAPLLRRPLTLLDTTPEAPADSGEFVDVPAGDLGCATAATPRPAPCAHDRTTGHCADAWSPSGTAAPSSPEGRRQPAAPMVMS